MKFSVITDYLGSKVKMESKKSERLNQEATADKANTNKEGVDDEELDDLLDSKYLTFIGHFRKIPYYRSLTDLHLGEPANEIDRDGDGQFISM